MAEINARGRRTRKRRATYLARHCRRGSPRAGDGYRRAIARAVEIGGCRAIVVDASVGADTTMRVALPAVPL
jgi:hypothetical protein